MSLFNIAFVVNGEDKVLKIGFGEPSTNNLIVAVVESTMKGLAKNSQFCSGLLKIDGPASLPVAFVIAHSVCHLFSAIAIRDPKIGFVVAVSHDPQYTVGDLIPA